MIPNFGHFTWVTSGWPWSCGCRYCLGQKRTGCGLGDQCDSFSLQCKLGICPWAVRGWRRLEEAGRRRKGGMGENRLWLSAEGLAVGLALPGARLQARKSMEEDGGYWRGCSCTGGKKLRRKLIKWVIENYCNFLLKRIKVNSPSVQLVRKHVNSYHSYVGKGGEIER